MRTLVIVFVGLFVVGCAAPKPAAVATAPKRVQAAAPEQCPVVASGTNIDGLRPRVGVFTEGWKHIAPDDPEIAGKNFDIALVNPLTATRFLMEVIPAAGSVVTLELIRKLILDGKDKAGSIETRELGCETISGFPALLVKSDGEIGTFVAIVSSKRTPGVVFLVSSLWPNMSPTTSRETAHEVVKMALSLRLVKK